MWKKAYYNLSISFYIVGFIIAIVNLLSSVSVKSFSIRFVFSIIIFSGIINFTIKLIKETQEGDE